MYPLASCFALDRDLLNHSPIILRVQSDDFGPPPFKLYNSWILKDGFDEVVKKACSEFVGFETPNAFLFHKLKYLKKVIRC